MTCSVYETGTELLIKIDVETGGLNVADKTKGILYFYFMFLLSLIGT